jgi:hypothetical protein
VDFPYWKRLHGFWHTLPNFNPYTALSEPGQDLAGEARALIQNRRVPHVTCDGDNGDDDDDDDNDNNDNLDSPNNTSSGPLGLGSCTDARNVSFLFVFLTFTYRFNLGQ